MATTEWRRISVTVGGNDLTAFLYGNDQTATLPDGPEVGRASITLRYDAEVDALGINDWDEVIIKAGITSATVTVWGGYVTRQSKEPASEMGGNVVINTLDCQSYAIRLVTTQPIEATFNDDVAGDPTQDYDIVGELVNTYLPTFYDSGSISGLSAVAISYIAFTGDNLRQALQKVVNLTRAMASQHGKEGIRVNCIAPGMVYTPMVYSRGMSDELRETRKNRSLLQTEGSGWDVGNAVVYLLSDEARWVTGIVLPVDAGATAGQGALPVPASDGKRG